MKAKYFRFTGYSLILCIQ